MSISLIAGTLVRLYGRFLLSSLILGERYEVMPSAIWRTNAVVTHAYFVVPHDTRSILIAPRVQRLNCTIFSVSNSASSRPHACNKKKRAHSSNTMIHSKMGTTSLDSILQHRVLFRNPSLEFGPGSATTVRTTPKNATHRTYMMKVESSPTRRGRRTPSTHSAC